MGDDGTHAAGVACQARSRADAAVAQPAESGVPHTALPVQYGASAGGWEGHLALRFDGGERTVLSRSEHRGPLRVQRPFYPAGDRACHVYVLHPPGGVVGGDELTLNVEACAGARTLLTAPGATKLYRSLGREARIEARFDVRDGSLVEHFPHELIAYSGCHAQQRTHVQLAADAGYVGWEIICLGRPSAGERFVGGSLRTELRIARNGRVCFQERGAYRGGDALLDAPYGLAGQPAFGTFVLAVPHLHPDWLSGLRALCTRDDCVASVTAVSGVLVLRAMAATTRVVRGLFEQAFALTRPHYAGCEAVLPRIWRT